MRQDFWPKLNDILEGNTMHLRNKYGINLNNEKALNYTDISKLRVQQIDLFKKYPEFLSKLEDNVIFKTIESSGTSGNPSRIFLSRDSVKRQKLNLSALFGNRFDGKQKKLIIYDLDPSLVGSSKLGARFAASLGYANQCKEYYFAFDLDSNGIWKLKSDFHKNIIDTSLETLHFGFTYVLYSQVGHLDIDFKDSKLFHIGGWKKLNDRSISKTEFNKLFESKNCSEVIDVYGFTELMGESFFDCSFGWKHFTENTLVSVREVDDPLHHRPEGIGLLQFTSVFPKDYLGNNILTDDIGEVIISESCQCGIPGGRFRFHSRRNNSIQRGCGDVLGENITAQDLSQSIHEFEIYDWNQCCFTKYDNSDKSSLNPGKFPDISIEDTLNILDQLTKHWLKDNNLAYLQRDGLSYLSKWCSSDNLQNLILDCLGIKDIRHMNTFRKTANGSYHYILPKGTISHWVAGNVPLLGMLVIVQGIVTANNQIVKLSSNAGDQLEKLLIPLNKLDFGSDELNNASKQILNSIRLIKINRKNVEIQNYISHKADTRVIWGGKNAIQNISAFNRKLGSNDIILGPRTSFAVMNSEYFLSNPVLARRMAKDIVSFDQNACSSPHSIFTLGEGQDDCYKQLIKSLIKEAQHDSSFDYVEQALKFLRLQNFGPTYFDTESGFIICRTKYKKSLLLPEFNKVIYLIEIESYNEIIDLITEDVQSISLVMKHSDKIELAHKLAQTGVTRFPEAGVMTEFDRYWDSYNIISSMIKYSVLNGPYI